MPEANAEWLEADGLGGFASGTVNGVRTRRYHALLLAAARPPGDRQVLVNGFDAEVSLNGESWALSTQCYAPAAFSPDGNQRLRQFQPTPWPTWTFSVAGGQVVQELLVVRGFAATIVRWSWVGPVLADVNLRVRPFFSGRRYHQLHHENGSFNFCPERSTQGERWACYPGTLPIQSTHNGLFAAQPLWYRNFFYAQEYARGMDFIEDLAAPGLWQFALGGGPAVLVFAAVGSGPELPCGCNDVAAWVRRQAAVELARRASFPTPHARAADSYLVQRGSGGTIIAGYPWFGDWGRDTFISLRGLCFTTRRWSEAGAILREWSGLVSQGMLPNRFADANAAPEYNSVDASLWYVIVLHEFLAQAPAAAVVSSEGLRLRQAAQEILTGYAAGTRHGIRLDPRDGLLACGEPGLQLTWMDAKCGETVFTPRIGKPVEIQALWLQALQHMVDFDPRWAPLLAQGQRSFSDRFWNEARGCLYDVVDNEHVPGQNDARLRPNQLFALGGLPLALIEGERAARALAAIEAALWTPLGLRTLAPDEPDYAGRYEGGLFQRDSRYHQGTVWPWLAGAFISAWLRVHGNTAENRALARQRFYEPGLARLDLSGLQHLPEIADGDAPHTPRGCPFQAWSVAEAVRIDRELLA